MTKSWFNTPERLRRLEESALSWVGTPFAANSRAKGPRGGVSCQMLAEQIYLECGVPVPSVPRGSMSWSAHSTISRIEKYLDGLPDILIPVDEDILPGDLMGYRIGGCVHHVALALERRRLIHCMRAASTTICRIDDPTFKSRLCRIWRINHELPDQTEKT